MQYLHWPAQYKQTGIVCQPGVMLYLALIICQRMKRGVVYQFCCCFLDAFISRFKECLNIKCLEIRKKKSNLKDKYYQSLKKNMHSLFIQGACLKFIISWKNSREREHYHAETERLFIRFIDGNLTLLFFCT